MRSAKLVEPKKIMLYENDPNPNVGLNEVLIRVKAVGICGTDIHVWHGERADVTLPRIMGHEFSGTVEKSSKNFQKGEKVVVDPVVSCGVCVSCKRGYPNLCSTVKCLGVQVEGAFCELIAVPENKVYRFPESLNWVQASMVEPYSIASEVIFRGVPVAGEKALVFGAGPIGLGILEGLKLRGLSVMVADLVESRLKKASELGADRIVNGEKEDLAQAVKVWTGEFGLDFAVDAVGNPKIMESAIEMAAPGGRIVVLGFNPTFAQVPELFLVRKELKIMGTRMNCNRFPEVIEWFREEKVHPDAVLSAVYPLEDVQKAFEHIASDPQNTLKVVVTL
ncbi:MAG: alcohol dehydrogenase catalytic domain-containing protein [Synergistaceae bacterium]|jgi:L-gulonate 5-dehydrogenase|nr:alcohol dehydrogenase catalytic domain-containing protein [Synergistaceae bacterium]